MMMGVKPKRRILLEESRRFRRWVSLGLGLRAGYVATLTGSRPKPAWKEIKAPPRAGFASRWQGPSRILVEPPVSVIPTPPECIQAGNPGAFPLGKVMPSIPGCVHWLPSKIYHGLHGAIMDRGGAVYAELLDGSVADLDMSQRRERALPFAGRVMALSCSKNYHHWLLKMLPRLALMERSEGSLGSIDAFLINKPTWQQEAVYKSLKIWDRCVVIDSKTFAVCRLLAAPSLAHDCAEWACRYVRNRLKPAGISGGRKRRIYITRGEAAHRRLDNEEEVCALVRGYGFEIVDCSGLGVAEQAALFGESDFVVGVHGAAFSNLVFCEPGGVVLEIFGTPKNQKGYWIISHHMRLQYHYLMGEPVESGPTGNLANMTVEPRLLARGIEAILEKRGRGEEGAAGRDSGDCELEN